jgi:glycosyltransferase involved in cell wall biosynthesis
MATGGRSILSVFGLAPSFIGGTENFAFELSRQLHEHGWSSVLCFDTGPTPIVRKFLDLPNVTLEVVPLQSGAAALRRVLAHHRPEVLHLHYTRLFSGYPWLAKLYGARQIVYTDHVSRPESHTIRPTPIWKRMVGRTLTVPISNMISVSDYVLKSNLGMGIYPQQRCQRVYNSVNLSRVPLPEAGVSWRRKYRVPLDCTMVTQVSWLIPEKGIVDYLKAAQLATRHQDGARLHFVVVGEGPHGEEYLRLAETLGIRDRVTFTGPIEDPFTTGLFAATDILCQFSRWEEAFGWSMAEAMAHGKPVVATRVGGIPEVVADGVTGYLVDRGDYHAMMNAILKLADDFELRRRLGVAGRKRVEERFEISANVARLLSIYGIGDGAPNRHAWHLPTTAGRRS